MLLSFFPNPSVMHCQVEDKQMEICQGTAVREGSKVEVVIVMINHGIQIG